MSNTLNNALIDVSDSILAVIDVQDHFLDKISEQQAKELISRVGWLMEIAQILDVPIIVTAEDIEQIGGMTASLVDKLPPDTRVHNKMAFGITGNPNIMETVHAIGRKTVILVGLETDVCVAQSAIGLLGEGYKAAALADATGSPNDAHKFGLERMRNAGVLITTVKGLYYEWVRTVAKDEEIREKHLGRIGIPLGVTL